MARFPNLELQHLQRSQLSACRCSCATRTNAQTCCELIAHMRVCQHTPPFSTISLTWLAVTSWLMKDNKPGLSLLHQHYKHNRLLNNGAPNLAFIRGIRSLIWNTVQVIANRKRSLRGGTFSRILSITSQTSNASSVTPTSGCHFPPWWLWSTLSDGAAVEGFIVGLIVGWMVIVTKGC